MKKTKVQLSPMKNDLGIKVKMTFGNGLNDVKTLLGEQVYLMDFQKVEPKDKEPFFRATLMSPKYSETIQGATNINVSFDTEQTFNKIEEDFSNKFVSLNELNIIDYTISTNSTSFKNKEGKDSTWTYYLLSGIKLGLKK